MTDTTEIDKVNRAILMIKYPDDDPNSPCFNYLARASESYATDIKMAWELLEEVMNSGGTFSLYDDNPPVRYCCMLAVENQAGQATAPTAPLAICLAYLKLKGVAL